MYDLHAKKDNRGMAFTLGISEMFVQHIFSVFPCFWEFPLPARNNMIISIIIINRWEEEAKNELDWVALLLGM